MMRRYIVMLNCILRCPVVCIVLHSFIEFIILSCVLYADKKIISVQFNSISWLSLQFFFLKGSIAALRSIPSLRNHNRPINLCPLRFAPPRIGILGLDIGADMSLTVNCVNSQYLYHPFERVQVSRKLYGTI